MKKALLFLLPLLALMFTSAFADPYVRLSGGASNWDSPEAPTQGSSIQDLFDDGDTAMALAIGTHVTDNFRVELEYSDYGSTSTSFNDSYQRCFRRWCRDYSDDYVTKWEASGWTGWVVYDIHLFNITEKMPVSMNVRGGITRAKMKATVNDQSLKDSDAGVAYGIGLDMDIGEAWQANLSWEQHSVALGSTPNMSYEPELGKLGVTYRF